MSEKRSADIDQDSQTGVLGRIGGLFWRSRAPGKPPPAKKKVTVAKLPEGNDFFYDEKTKTWRERGKEVETTDSGKPPSPPKSFSSSRPPSVEALNALAQSSGEATSPKRSASSSMLPSPGTNMYSSRGSAKDIRNRYVDVAGKKSDMMMKKASFGSMSELLTPGAPAGAPLSPGKQPVSMFVPKAAMSTSQSGPAMFMPVTSASGDNQQAVGSTATTDGPTENGHDALPSESSSAMPAKFLPKGGSVNSPENRMSPFVAPASPSEPSQPPVAGVGMQPSQLSQESAPAMFVPRPPEASGSSDQLLGPGPDQQAAEEPSAVTGPDDEAEPEQSATSEEPAGDPAPTLFVPTPPEESSTPEPPPQEEHLSEGSVGEEPKASAAEAQVTPEPEVPLSPSQELSSWFKPHPSGHSRSASEFFAQIPSPQTGSHASSPGEQTPEEYQVPGLSNLKGENDVSATANGTGGETTEAGGSYDYSTYYGDAATSAPAANGEYYEQQQWADAAQEVEGFAHVPYMDAEGNWQYYYGDVNSDEYKYYYQLYCDYYSQYQTSEAWQQSEYAGEGWQQAGYGDGAEYGQYYAQAADGTIAVDANGQQPEGGSAPQSFSSQPGVALEEAPAEQPEEEPAAEMPTTVQPDDIVPPPADEPPPGDQTTGAPSGAEQPAEVVTDSAAQESVDAAPGPLPEDTALVPASDDVGNGPFGGNVDGGSPEAEANDSAPVADGDLLAGKLPSLGSWAKENASADLSESAASAAQAVDAPTPVESDVTEAPAPKPVRKPQRKPRTKKTKGKLAKSLPWETAAAEEVQPLIVNALSALEGLPDVAAEEDLVPLASGAQSPPPNADTENTFVFSVKPSPASDGWQDEQLDTAEPLAPREVETTCSARASGEFLADEHPMESVTEHADDAMAVSSVPTPEESAPAVEEDTGSSRDDPVQEELEAPAVLSKSTGQEEASAVLAQLGADNGGWVGDLPQDELCATDSALAAPPCSTEQATPAEHAESVEESELRQTELAVPHSSELEPQDYSNSAAPSAACEVMRGPVDEPTDALQPTAETTEEPPSCTVCSPVYEDEVTRKVAVPTHTEELVEDPAAANIPPVGEDGDARITDTSPCEVMLVPVEEPTEALQPGAETSEEPPSCTVCSPVYEDEATRKVAVCGIAEEHVEPAAVNIPPVGEDDNAHITDTVALKGNGDPLNQSLTSIDEDFLMSSIDHIRTDSYAGSVTAGGPETLPEGLSQSKVRIAFTDMATMKSMRESTDSCATHDASYSHLFLTDHGKPPLAPFRSSTKVADVDVHTTADFPPSAAQRRKAKRLDGAVDGAVLQQAVKGISKWIEATEEAEASSISVMHCRIVALEQENVMLRVGRKADAESCQELEAQLADAHQKLTDSTAEIWRHLKRPCQLNLEVATDGSVVVGLCTASPVDQLICENVELQEELDRRLEEVQRLLELEGGQTALLQEQLNKRSNEVQILLDLEQANQLLRQQLEDKDEDLCRSQTELATLASSSAEDRKAEVAAREQLHGEVAHLTEELHHVRETAEQQQVRMAAEFEEANTQLAAAAAELVSSLSIAEQSAKDSAAVSSALAAAAEDQVTSLLVELAEARADAQSTREALESAMAEAAAAAQQGLTADEFEAKHKELASALEAASAAEEEVTRLLEEQEQADRTEAELQLRVAKLEEELQARTEASEEQSRAVAEAEQRLQAAEAKAETYQHDLEAMVAEKMGSAEQLAQLSADLSTAKGAAAEAQVGLEDAAARNLQLAEEKSAAIAEAAAAKQEVDALAQRLESQLHERGELMEVAKKEVDEVKSKLRAAVKKGKAIEKDKQALEVQLKEANARITEAEERAATVEANAAIAREASRDAEAATRLELEEARAEAAALKESLHEALQAEGQAVSRAEACDAAFVAVSEAAVAAMTSAEEAHSLSNSRTALDQQLVEAADEAMALACAAVAACEQQGAAAASEEELRLEIDGMKARLQAAEAKTEQLQQDNEELQDTVATQQQEFNDLLACLGQETAKVVALQDVLAEQGVDTDEILAKVEEEYGFGEEEEEDQEL